jgi:arylsulfatase A-like enzyme
MTASRPNVLFVMTDEERYPPPYEAEALAEFRRTQLPARARLRAQSRELHHHYAAATACIPSRASLFTGQYPSLHGVTATDGMAKSAVDPAMHWLDPESVPTMGDWFRAAGYRTHYRGKWHISHADLVVPGTHESLRVNDADGVVDPEAVDAYRRADRLDGFGFSGWIGREPHGADKADTGVVRDGMFAEQVVDLFAELAASDGSSGEREPWLAVASFVNPHDIGFTGFGWNALGFPLIPGSIPDVPEAPSQSDPFAGRPDCQRQFAEVWPKLLYAQEPDLEYRRLYHFLHTLVDAAIMRILDALEDAGLADDTIVVFTSDHGDLLGAHGGLVQKWHNAFDEAIHVPMLVSGPGIDPDAGGIGIATGHVDVIPTLLGLAGVDVEAATAGVARHHVETQPLPGRDLSGVLTEVVAEADVDAPVYFMTEDQISRGLRTTNRFTGDPYEPVGAPDKVESVIARLATAPGGTDELWKLNHYYDRLTEWEESRGIPQSPLAPPRVESQWELHNLTVDPEERNNLAAVTDGDVVLSQLQAVLERTRDTVRRTPRHVNPRP